MRCPIVKLIRYFQWHVPPSGKSRGADNYRCTRCGHRHIFSGTRQEMAQILADENGERVVIVGNGETVTAHPMGERGKSCSQK